MSKKQYTPRQRFARYLAQFLHWQRLPRGSVERAQAFAAWLARGQHKGGKPSKADSSTDGAAHIKQHRTRWLRKGLDMPPPGTLPGDFANPDPRACEPLTTRTAAPEPRQRAHSVRAALALFSKQKPPK